MSSFNDTLKNITLKELCIVIILLFLVYYAVNSFSKVYMANVWVYIFVILFFLFKFRHSFADLKNEFLNAISYDSVKIILVIVVLNIFFSYGMLYFSDFLLKTFPDFNFLIEFPLSLKYLNHSADLAWGFLATIIVSPISEELVFRGVLLNRLNKVVPVLFSILISSILFASLHSFGSLISAFVFGLCMAILYFRTQNIFVAILAHFINNVIAETIVFCDSQNLIFSNGPVVGIVSVLAVISAIVLAYLLFHELNNIK